jgi:phage shock protein PspC (stress-responsive transcriptional regulator)
MVAQLDDGRRQRARGGSGTAAITAFTYRRPLGIESLRPVPDGLSRRGDLRPWHGATREARVTGMNDDIPTSSPRRVRLQRRRQDRVLGGVCAAIARSLGIDPVLVRIAAVALALVSAGTAALAYLVGWVLIPQEKAGSAASGAAQTEGVRAVAQPTARADIGAGTETGPEPPAGDARAAWNAAGSELRTLASGLRPVREPTGDPTANRRSPVDTVDSVITGVGERLRDPTVQASARRAAAQVSAAVGASAEAAGRRTRREAAAGDQAEGGQAEGGQAAGGQAAGDRTGGIAEGVRADGSGSGTAEPAG